jgi:hypothetical protein
MVSEKKQTIVRRDRCAIFIIISWAGPLAEPRLLEQPDGWDSDLDDIEAYLEIMEPDKSKRKALWADLQCQSLELVMENFASVKRVAEALMQVKRLNRRDMINLMECAG